MTALLIAAFAVAACVFLIPTIIAINRGHTQVVLVFLLNLLLGLGIIPWFLALAWALNGKTNSQRLAAQQAAKQAALDAQRRREEFFARTEAEATAKQENMRKMIEEQQRRSDDRADARLQMIFEERRRRRLEDRADD